MRPTLVLAALFASTSVAAKPATADYMSRSATFTQADILNARASSLGKAVLGALPDSLGAQGVNIVLVDRQGVTQVEVMCASTAIYEMQNGSEFTRRGALNGTHDAILKALLGAGGEGGGGGWFGTATAPSSASEKVLAEFIGSREPSDLVVSIGWSAKEGNFVYTTLYSDRIEMNPDAPKAKK